MEQRVERIRMLRMRVEGLLDALPCAELCNRLVENLREVLAPRAFHESNSPPECVPSRPHSPSRLTRSIQRRCFPRYALRLRRLVSAPARDRVQEFAGARGARDAEVPSPPPQCAQARRRSPGWSYR